MILVGDVLLSDAVVEARFRCELQSCGGRCCVDGDLGSPLGEDERTRLGGIVEALEEWAAHRCPQWAGLTDSCPWYLVLDEGKVVLATREEGECVFSFVDPATGAYACVLHRAWEDGAVPWCKPAFCELFPIVVESFYGRVCINLERRSGCCDAGFSADAPPLLLWNAEALIRRFGARWYAALLGSLADVFAPGEFEELMELHLSEKVLDRIRHVHQNQSPSSSLHLDLELHE